MQENLRKALEEFGKAAGSLKGKKKSHKGRNAMLLAGLVAGALYNPWSGPQTREWLMDKVAGDDDLQPLDGFDLPGDELDTELAATSNGSAEPRGCRRGNRQREVGQPRPSGLDPRPGSSGPGR